MVLTGAVLIFTLVVTILANGFHRISNMPVPIFTPLFTPSPTVTKEENNILQFQYPDSQILTSEQDLIILESTANPTVITDWYKTKIKNLAFHTTSFIQTSTNGNVLNKLAAESDKAKILVDISKDSERQPVNISVNFKNKI